MWKGAHRGEPFFTAFCGNKKEAALHVSINTCKTASYFLLIKLLGLREETLNCGENSHPLGISIKKSGLGLSERELKL